MKQYVLNVIQPTGAGPDNLPPPDELDRIMKAVDAVDQAMHDAGVWVFAGGLHHPSASTVVKGDLVTDGPFLESKEHVGGFSIIKAADLDEALEWARKLSEATTLPIEVRPVQE